MRDHLKLVPPAEAHQPARDWGLEAQRAAENRLSQCMDAYWHGEECQDADCGEHPYDPSCAPFDACDTCIVREVLDAAAPFFEKAAAETSSS